jgi:hypothetical protein
MDHSEGLSIPLLLLSVKSYLGDIPRTQSGRSSLLS